MESRDDLERPIMTLWTLNAYKRDLAHSRPIAPPFKVGLQTKDYRLILVRLGYKEISCVHLGAERPYNPKFWLMYMLIGQCAASTLPF